MAYELSFQPMTGRPLVVQRSCLVVVLSIMLLVVTGATLLHWHKDWSDQGCQLCHVRHLTTLHTPFSAVQANPPTSAQQWNSDISTEELDTLTGSISTRAPPASAPSSL